MDVKLSVPVIWRSLVVDEAAGISALLFFFPQAAVAIRSAAAKATFFAVFMAIPPCSTSFFSRV
jgi:hypothetical protein